MRSARTLALGLLLLPAGLAGCGGDDDVVPDGNGDADGDADGDGDGDADGDGDGDADAEQDPLTGPLQRLRDASARPTDVGFREGFPKWLVGAWDVDGDDPVARARAFLETYAELFGQGPEHELAVGTVREGDHDLVRLFQRWHGIPVWGGELSIVLLGSTVFGVVGSLEIEGRVLDPNPHLAPDQALERVRELLDRPGQKAHGEVELFVWDPGLLDDATPFEPHLAYMITFPDLRVFLDAHDGTILLEDPMEHEALNLFLLDGMGTNAKATDCFTDGNFPLAATDGSVMTDYLNDEDVADMRGHAHGAYQYYLSTFARDGYHGFGWLPIPTFMIAHTNSSGGASWSPGCGMFQWTDPYVGDDVAVHEFTHAVITYTSNLSYHYESGALNESYADVMASFATGDWLMGDTSPNGTIRDLSDPPAFGQPDHWSGMVYTADNKQGDWGGVHTNSGIPNKAAFLLSDGGELRGRVIEGIGQGRAEQLLYLTMTSLPSDATFKQAAAMTGAMVNLLEVLVGDFGPPDLCSVRNAYAAVGLGVGDADCDGTLDTQDSDDDDDGVLDTTDNCDNIPNPSQKDTNANGVGDACSNDDDGDGVLDQDDNCNKPNPGQGDQNHNGIGDLCEDYDDDGVVDLLDNCAGEPNANQLDTDGDGDGDACDPDHDDDGVSAGQDNCPFDPNADQIDTDLDGLGDVCDECPSAADGASAWTPGIPELGIPPQPVQADQDGDGTPDACDREAWGGGISVSTELGALIAPGDAVLALDGLTRSLVITGNPGDVIDLPFPICPGDCPEWFRTDDPIELAIDRLGNDVTVLIVDDLGRAPAASHEQPVGAVPLPRVLGVSPEGLRRYRVRLRFESSFPGGRSNFGDFTITAPEQ